MAVGLRPPGTWTERRTQWPRPDGLMRLVLTGGQATPRGNNLCSQRAKETFFHLHRWLMRTKRKICTEGNAGHPGWGDPGFYIRDSAPGGKTFRPARAGCA
jgi:hypothetical protein